MPDFSAVHPASPVAVTPFGEFGAEIGIDADRASIVVRGEVDIATAPTFGDLLGVLVDHGHTHIVVDMEHLGFLDASGIGAIAQALARLRLRAGHLSLRSVPAPIRRVLDITGFSALVDIEPDEPRRFLPTEESERLTSDRADAPNRAGIYGRFGALPASNDTIDAALRLVVSLASATVQGADGVSVSLHRHGQLMTAAASDATVLEMDHNQYETGEGPCLSAAAEGHWFHIEALADEDRWPAFVPRAIDEGIASILSSPLMTAGRPIGALNIYSRAERAFGPAEQELAALFATHVSGILVDAGADVSEEESTARIHAALLSRKIIAQAQGMLMERQHISADDAAGILGRASRSAGRTVLDQATRVTESNLGGAARTDEMATTSLSEDASAVGARGSRG